MSQVDFPNNWQVLATSEQVAQEVCDRIIELANHAIAKQGAFHLVTAGGTTPNLIYSLLAQCEQQQPAVSDWQKWFLYLGDERVLPAGDAERNSQMLCKYWLDNSQIPEKNRYFMPTEHGLNAAADAYRKAIATVTFDVVLLGMGEDGHTASLFPGHRCVSLGGVVCEVDSPKAPAERLSLSYESLSAAQTVIKIITGRSKTPALNAWLQGEDLPISRVKGIEETRVYLDQAAVQALTSASELD